MIHPIKIEFKDYPSGSWIDWSDHLATPPSINCKVESENEGEAGIIVFDKASVEFHYTPGSPVYTAFETDLTNKQRYLFRISFYDGSTYQQRFEGMADFSTIDEPELSNIIAFDIVDKLSAIGILEASTLREKNIDVFARSGADGIDTFLQMYQPNQSGTDYLVFRIWDLQAGERGRYTNFTDTNIIQAGEVFTIIEGDVEKLAIATGETSIIWEVDTDTEPPYSQYNFQSVRAKVIVSESYANNSSAALYEFSGSYLIYDKKMLGVDINIVSGSTLEAFDGEKIIEAIVKQQWADITFVNKTSAGAFPIPLNYVSGTTGDLPFNKEPLDALKMLADSMKCYIFFNRAGELVIQSKDDLGTNGITRAIGSTRKIDANKKRFWDKLIDAAEVKIKSWVQVDGEFIEGYSLQTKAAPGSSSYIKPKNKLTKELFASSSSIDTQAELDAEAAIEALDYLDFYGKRRSSIELILELDNNVLLWDLLDNITYNSVNYFFTSLDLDLVEKEASLELVEVIGHDYDLRSVVIPLSQNQQSVISSGGTSGGGTTVINNNYSFNTPLSSSGNVVDLSYTDNLKVTGNSLDTAQPIRTSSTPTFLGLNLNNRLEVLQGVTSSKLSRDSTQYLKFTTNASVNEIRGYSTSGDAKVFSLTIDDVSSGIRLSNYSGKGISISSAGVSTITGDVEAEDKIRFSADSSFSSGEEAAIFRMSTNGLSLQVGDGTVNDFSLISKTGTVILRNPTGTNDVEVYGEFNALNIQTSNYDQSTPQFTKIHARALIGATVFDEVTAIGYNAGYGNDGSRVTAIGHYSMAVPLSTNVAQAYSTGIGYYAGYNIDASHGVYIGYQAGYQIKGNTAVAIGYQAGYQADSTAISQGSDSVFIGQSAGKSALGYRNAFIGLAAGHDSSSRNSIAIGYAAGQYSNEEGSIMIGYYAGHGQTGDYNVYIGYQTRGVSKNTRYNTFVGYRAGYDFDIAETDSHLIGVGTYALRQASRYIQTGIGFYAGYQSSSGLSIFIGASAGYLSNANTNSAYQNGIGYQALREATGTNIEAFGGYAGYQSTSSQSTYIGYGSGDGSSENNVIGLGVYAGKGASGSNSMYLGYNAGYQNSTTRMFQIKHNQSTALMTGDFNSNSIGFNTNVSPTDGRLQFNELHLEQVGNKSYYNNFTSGWTGSGFRLDYGIATTNTATLELDDLWVRGTMHVYELLIQQIRATNGSLIVSSSAKVKEFGAPFPPNDVLILDDPSGHNLAPFLENDIVLVQRVRLDSTTLVKRLVRKVLSVNQTTIVLGALGDGPSDTGTFEIGDTLVRIGNTTNTSRQGVLYLTSDDSNAPYMNVVDNVTSWADWLDTDKTKARIGKLTGLTDDAFGSLSGYGLFTRRAYFSSGDTTGIQLKVDEDTAYFAMKQGSNIVFDFDTATATAQLAGWDVTHQKIGRTISLFKHIEMNSAGHLYAGYGYAPLDGDDNGVVIGIIPSGQPNAGYVGIQSRDGFADRTFFTLTDQLKKIASWEFDHQKLFSGTDIVLDGSSKKVSVNNDAVQMYYTGGSDYGIKDSAGKFQLGSTNQIAGWVFDTTKFSNGDVRLEASASLKGLGIKSGTDTVIKIGDFNNAAESYFTSSVTLSQSTWTTEHNSHTTSFTISNSNYEITLAADDPTAFTQVSARYSMPLPINDVKGKTVKIIIDTKQVEGGDGDGQVNLVGMIKLNDRDLELKDITTTVQDPVGASYTRFTFYGSIPLDSTEAEFWFYYQYNSAAVDPATISVKFISCDVYTKSIVELNKSGFLQYSSPITSIDLRDGKADFNVSSLRTSNSIEIGNWRFITQIGLLGDGSTYQKLVVQFNDGSGWSSIGRFRDDGDYATV